MCVFVILGLYRMTHCEICTKQNEKEWVSFEQQCLILGCVFIVKCVSYYFSTLLYGSFCHFIWKECWMIKQQEEKILGCTR